MFGIFRVLSLVLGIDLCDLVIWRVDDWCVMVYINAEHRFGVLLVCCLFFACFDLCFLNFWVRFVFAYVVVAVVVSCLMVDCGLFCFDKMFCFNGGWLIDYCLLVWVFIRCVALIGFDLMMDGCYLLTCLCVGLCLDTLVALICYGVCLWLF